MAKENSSATAEYKQALQEALPSLLAEWIDLVRDSEDPKAYKELIDHGVRVLGMEPKNDRGADLPVFSINFLSADGQTHLVQLTGSGEQRPAPASTGEVEDAVEVVAAPVALPEPMDEPADIGALDFLDGLIDA